MKRIVLIILLCFQLVAQAIDQLPLKEYISMISNDLDMTIVISDEIEEDFTLYANTDNLNNSDYLKILVQILKKNDLTIEPFENFFLISRANEENEKQELQFIELKNVDYETIKPLFKTVSNVNHSYIASNKTIAFKSTQNQFTRLAKLIQKLDKTPKQLKLRVTIIDTNLDKLKDYGLELKQLNTFTSSHNFFFNLLAYPFTVSSEVSETKTQQLHSFIRFMDKNSLSSIKSATTLSLFDNRVTRFDIVNNIPYINGKTTTQDGNTSSITSYSYKDVGLKLQVKPRIYSNNVYLDLELTSENVLKQTDTPTTSKNYVKQTITMNKNKIFVLTGINQNSNYHTLDATPFLSDVPFLGWLFKLDNKNNITSNLTIFLELIDNEYVSIKEDRINIELPTVKEEKKELTTNQKHQKRVNEILGINQ